MPLLYAFSLSSQVLSFLLTKENGYTISSVAVRLLGDENAVFAHDLASFTELAAADKAVIPPTLGGQLGLCLAVVDVV